MTLATLVAVAVGADSAAVDQLLVCVATCDEGVCVGGLWGIGRVVARYFDSDVGNCGATSTGVVVQVDNSMDTAGSGGIGSFGVSP